MKKIMTIEEVALAIFQVMLSQYLAEKGAIATDQEQRETDIAQMQHTAFKRATKFMVARLEYI